MNNVASYIKNLGKSVKYAAIDDFKENYTSITSFAETNSQLFKEVYAAAKDYKGTVSKASNTIKNSKIYEAADVGMRAAMEDLRTGNFYNKERKDEMDLKAMGSLGDFSDMDIDFDDDSDMNIDSGDRLVSSTVSNAAQLSSEAISSSVLRSASIMSETTKASTKMIYTQNATLFSRLGLKVDALSRSVNDSVAFSNNTLVTHANNSKVFFESTSKLLQEQNAIMKEILEMQRNLYKNAQAQENKKAKTKYNDIVDVNGMPDLKQYFLNVKNNITAAGGSTAQMLFGGMGEDSNMLLSFVSSPLQFIPQLMINGLLPASTKKLTKDLDKTLSGFFGSMIAKINYASKKQEDNGNSIVAKILKVLGVHVSSKDTVNPTASVKGAVPFDGMTHRTINEVIPGYLRKIESLLSGSEERVYNHQTGRWVKASSIKGDFENIRKQNVSSASYDVRSYMDEFRKEIVIANAQQSKNLDDAIQKIIGQIYSDGGFYNPNDKREFNSSKYGVSPQEYAMFRGFWKKLPRNVQMQFAGSVMNTRDREAAYMQDLENAGVSTYALLSNGSDLNSGIDAKKNRKGDILSTSSKAGNLINTKDNLGNNIFFYLQNINRELTYMRTYGSSRPGKGNKYGKSAPGNFDSIKIQDNSTISALTKELKNEQESDLRYTERENQKLKEGKIAFDLNGDEKDIDKNMWAIGAYNDEKDRKSLNEAHKGLNKSLNNIAKQKKGYLDKNGLNQDSMLDRLLAAKNITDKYNVIVDEIGNIGSKSTSLINKVLARTDMQLYSFIFGKDNGEKDEDGKPISGFFDHMVYQMKLSFNHLNDWLDEKILEPMKKKLGIDNMGDLADKILGIFGTSREDIKRKTIGLKDETGEREGGVLSPFINSTKNKFKTVGKYFYDSTKEVYHPITSGIKNAFSTLDDNQVNDLSSIAASGNISALTKWSNNNYKYASKETKELYSAYYRDIKDLNNIYRSGDINKLARWGNSNYNSAPSEMKDLYSKYYQQMMSSSNPISTHADGARFVTKSGLTAISRGEMIIPSKYNKSIERANENNIKNRAANNLAVIFNRLIGAHADGKDAGDDVANAVDGLKKDKAETVSARINGSMSNENATQAGYVAQGIQNVKNGVNDFRKQLFGPDAKKESDSFMKEVVDKTKANIPDVVSSAVVGGSISLMTGVVGGPLLGAAVGAASSIVNRSEKFKEMLFGTDHSGFYEKDGQQRNALISAELQKTIPDMGKFAAAGAVTSLFTPFGVVGGALIGGSVGFLKNNEKVQEALFGEDGLISPNRQDKIKKAMPNVSVATIGSLFLGPFGLVGNAALGAGLGLISTTDEFKTFMFGEEDDHGERKGGLAGALHDSVIDPIKKFMGEMKDRISNFVVDDIINPVKDAIKPIGKEIGLGLKKIFTTIPDKINEFFEDKIGIPLSDLVKEKIIQPVTGFLSKTLKILLNPAKFILSAPSKMIGALGNSLRYKQIKKGNADYMTAEERLQFRHDHPGRTRLSRLNPFLSNDKFEADDEFLASMSGESAKEAYGLMQNINDKHGAFRKDQKEIQSGIAGKVSDLFDDRMANKKFMLSKKNRKNILQSIQDGNLKKAEKLIHTVRGKDGNKLGYNDQKELSSYLKDAEDQLMNIKARKGTEKKTKEEMYDRLRELGFTNLNKKTMSRYSDLLRTESKAKLGRKGENEKDPVSATIDTSITENTDKIIEVLKDTNKLLSITMQAGSYEHGNMAGIDPKLKAKMLKRQADRDKIANKYGVKNDNEISRRKAELEKFGYKNISATDASHLMDSDENYNMLLKRAQYGKKFTNISDIMGLDHDQYDRVNKLSAFTQLPASELKGILNMPTSKFANLYNVLSGSKGKFNMFGKDAEGNMDYSKFDDDILNGLMGLGGKHRYTEKGNVASPKRFTRFKENLTNLRDKQYNKRRTVMNDKDYIIALTNAGLMGKYDFTSIDVVKQTPSRKLDEVLKNPKAYIKKYEAKIARENASNEEAFGVDTTQDGDKKVSAKAKKLGIIGKLKEHKKTFHVYDQETGIMRTMEEKQDGSVGPANSQDNKEYDNLSKENKEKKFGLFNALGRLKDSVSQGMREYFGTDSEKEKKDNPWWSRLLKFGGKIMIAWTAISAVPKIYEFLKDSVLPKLETTYNDYIAPHLDNAKVYLADKFSGAIEKLHEVGQNILGVTRGIGAWFRSEPTAVGGGLKGMLNSVSNWITGNTPSGGFPLLFQTKIAPYYATGLEIVFGKIAPILINVFVQCLPSIIRGALTGLEALMKTNINTLFGNKPDYTVYDKVVSDYNSTYAKSGLSNVTYVSPTSMVNSYTSAGFKPYNLSGGPGNGSGATVGSVSGKAPEIKQKKIEDRYKDLHYQKTGKGNGVYNKTGGVHSSVTATQTTDSGSYTANGLNAPGTTNSIWDALTYLFGSSDDTDDGQLTTTELMQKVEENKKQPKHMFAIDGQKTLAEDLAGTGLKALIRGGKGQVGFKVLSKLPGHGIGAAIAKKIYGGKLVNSAVSKTAKVGSSALESLGNAGLSWQKSLGNKITSKFGETVADTAAGSLDNVVDFASSKEKVLAKKAGKKVVSETAEAAAETAAKPGILKKLVKFIKELVEKIFNSGAAKEALQKGAESTGKELSEEASEKMLKQAGKTVGKELGEQATKGIAKASSKVLAKVGSMLASGGLINAAFAVADFVTGMTGARNILGYTKTQDITFGERFLAGCIKALNGFIAFGLIPETLIANILIDVIAPMFGEDTTKMQTKRSKSAQELAEYNAKAALEGKETFDSVQDYNNRNSFGVKAKKAFKKGAKKVGGAIVGAGKAVVGGAKHLGGHIASAGRNMKESYENFENSTNDHHAASIKLYEQATTLKGLWSTDNKYDDGFAGAWEKFNDFTSKLGYSIPLLPASIIKGAGDAFKSFVGGMKKISAVNDATKASKTKALHEGSFKDLWDDKGIKYDDGFPGFCEHFTDIGYRAAYTIPTAVHAAGNGIKKGFGVLVSGFKQLGISMANGYRSNAKAMKDGDLKALWKGKNAKAAKISGLPGVIDNIVNTMYNVGYTIPTAVHAAGNGIKKGFGVFVNFQKNLYKTNTANNKLRHDAMKKGSLDTLWTSKGTYGTGFEGVLEHTNDIYLKVGYTIPTTVHAAGNKLVDGIEKLFDFGSSVTSTNKTNKELREKLMKEGDLKGLWKEKGTFDDGFAGVMERISDIMHKVTYSLPTMIMAVGNGMTSIPGKVFGGITSTWNKFTGGVSGAWDSITNWVSGSTDGGSSRNQYKYGTGYNGFYSQYDPQYSMQYNKSGDHIYQNMANSGCGPSVAATVARRLGSGANPAEAASYSLKNGYKETDGGTKPGFFGSYLQQHGISTKKIGNSDVSSMLDNGNPVILMGKTNNADSSTPYGPSPHYIVATGKDKNGNVIVQDPEATSPNQVFRYNKVINNSSVAIAAGKGSYGYGSGRVVLRDKLVRLSGGRPSQRKALYGRGYNHIGDYVKKFESGSKGSASISSGSGDHGGVSFGTYQMASGNSSHVSSSSNLYKFWNKYYASSYTGVHPGNNAQFKKAWSSAVSADPSGFALNEYKFMKSNYYKPCVNNLKSVINPDTHSRAVQELVWATAIGFGATTGARVIKKALGNKNVQKKSATWVINKVCDYLANNVSTLYRSSSAQVQHSMWKRYDISERETLLGISSLEPLTNDNVADSDSSTTTTTTTLLDRFTNIGSAMFGDLGTAFGLGKYGLASSVNILTDFSNIGDALFGNLGNEVFNGTETTTTDSSTSSAGSSRAKKAVDAMLSIKGKNLYDQTLRNHVDDTLYGAKRGYGDCSSTVEWAYKTGANYDPGSWTGAQIKKGKVIDTDLNKSNLKPGDLMFYRKSSSPSSDIGHVEMYMGNGKRIGHGSGIGPKISGYTTSKDRYEYSRRYLFGSGSGNTAKYGMGPYAQASANVAKQIISSSNRHYAGYGMASDNSTAVNTTMVQLIQAVIQILGVIADNTAKLSQISEVLESKLGVKISDKTNATQIVNSVKTKAASSGTGSSDLDLDSSTQALVSIMQAIASS